jgi:gamma-glutamyltranspeptidase/glutathione hydrolase
MPLSRLFAPAMRYAEDGCPIAPRVARDWAASRYKLSRDPAARAVFLPGGQAPAAGEIHKQPALAETLGEIASGGRDAFYRGKITAEIVRRLRASGGKHTAADFAEYDAEYVRPICAGYRGVAVYECPPSSQGAIALLMLKIMRRFDWQKLSGGERAARFAAITKVAYKKRDALLADPRISGGGDVFWDDHTADKIADNIMSDKTPRLRRAASPPPIKKRGRGDTVYLCVADDKGYALSLICSLFERFGAALLAPRCGVLLHNRGLCFSASRKAGHPNACAPRKRPLHTIIPALAVGGGKRAMPFGVMGGDYQAAGHAQFLMNVLDLKMDPQQALDAPRLFFIAADGGAVEVEPGISAPMRAALVRRGFRVVAADDPIGGGQAIWRDDNSGVLIAASDPRKDGVAAGF